MLFICIFIVIVNFETVFSSSNSKYCDAEILHKPYIKIYHNRGGPLLKDYPGPPGFYSTAEIGDIYVCINGPAWFYFARHNAVGDVFHKPEFHVYEHECQAFNGIPYNSAINTAQDRELLMGIYLLGDNEDYTLPSIHLFTTPHLNPITHIYENVSSVITIGNQPCTLIRGGDTQITVIPRPENAEDSFCKLPYQEIENIYIPTPAGSTTPDGPIPHDPDVVKNLLKNDQSLVEGVCKEKYEGISDVDKLQIKFNTTRDSLNRQIEVELTKLLALPPLVDVNLTNIPSQYPALDAIIANTTANVTDEERKEAEEEKKKLEAEQEILVEQQKVIDHATTSIDAVKKDNDTLVSNWLAVQEELDKLALDLEDLATKKNATIDAENNYLNDNTTANKDALDKAKTDVEAAETLIKTELRKVEDLFLERDTVARKLLADIKMAIQAVYNVPRFRPGEKFVAPTFTSPAVLEIPQTYSFPNGTVVDDNNCEPLPLVEDACAKAKPSVKRACQFLQAITNGPAICQQDELATTVSTTPLTPLEDLMGNVLEIINLIGEIFTYACQKLDANFAKRINSVFMCYLIKPTKNGGGGFDIRDAGTGDPNNTPKDWENNKWQFEVKEALKACKDEQKQLFFKKNPISGNYVLALKNKTRRNTKEIFLHKEQADLQFAFNFAIEMHFKIFATVMGICMSSKTNVPRNSLMTSTFYAKYVALFQEVESQWIDPKDNKIFKLILGNYKHHGGKFWASRCMEGSFIKSGDITYRPLRKIKVNGHSEGNYFINGKLAGTRGKYEE